MPRLYRTANGHWRSVKTEVEQLARDHGVEWETVDVDPSVKGLLALLNGPHVGAPAQLNGETVAATDPGMDLKVRAMLAVQAFIRGRKRVTSYEVENHLRERHRIGGGSLWIGQMLRRNGWVARREFVKGIARRFYEPAEPPLKDLATSVQAEAIPDLLTAAETVLANPVVQPYIRTTPYAELAAAVAELAAAVAETRAEIAQGAAS